MKILLFTHMNDIDGLGNVVLAKLAFSDVNYELCRTFEINNKVQKYFDSGDIYKYDKIFVTDICIKEPLLKIIDEDIKLKDKVLIFDHHKSEIAEGNDKYSWIDIIIENDNGKCCGTSLFYDYIIKNNYLSVSESNNRFVELTRQYDTWEWITKYNDIQARQLNILMDLIGEESYINLMYNKLRSSNSFTFNEYETNLINNEETKIKAYINETIDNMFIMELNNNKLGVLFSELYRNDIAEEIRNRGIDIDYIAIVNGNKKQVSYRNINSNFDVSKIAVSNGGKGHKEAAANPITEEQFRLIIKLLIK